MIRIGQSTDIHPLVKNRKLIIGGVEINSSVGLDGHSDGDLLLHAVAESILGALGENDLGCLFPDNDKTTLGISSMVILDKVYEVMDAKGFKIGNVDSIVIIENVKLRPYVAKMRENIARVLHTDVGNVNVKATRGEKLGFIGEGKGAVAQAVVLIESK